MAKKHSAPNERLKHRYLEYLKEAKRFSVETVDGVAKAIDRFEQYTDHRDFRQFHYKQAIGFKEHLRTERNRLTGNALSSATMHATLSSLRAFFYWLVERPGFRPQLNYSDADYFNLSEKECRAATARRDRPGPTVDQMELVLTSMPSGSDLEKRNRALIAFTLVTGGRDGAVASLKMKHVDLTELSVFWDPREVKTKFSKSFTTTFFPISPLATAIAIEWVKFLREKRHWGGDDPLFPATLVGLGATRQFQALGLERVNWSDSSPIRKVFKDACAAVGLRYFNPHSLRKTIAQCGERMCRTAEEFKAWSQNLGHEGVLTTLYSYGAVAAPRQAELIRGAKSAEEGTHRHAPDADSIARSIVREMAAKGMVIKAKA